MEESLLFTIYRWRNRHWVLETWSRLCSKQVAQSTLSQIFQCEDLILQPLCCWERKGNVCYKESCGSHWYWSSNTSGALSFGAHDKLHFSIDFGDRQISFEKAVWFSEEIYIQKGYGLIEKFASTNNFVESDWDAGITAECSRSIDTI